MTQQPDTLADSAPVRADGRGASAEPVFPTLARWVADWLAPMIRRPDRQDQAWCPEWWRHPEAIARLEALWRAWEALRLDDVTGMSVWWRDHADHHLPHLFDNHGPFSKCRGQHKRENPPLVVKEPPSGWFGEPSETPQESTA